MERRAFIAALAAVPAVSVFRNESDDWPTQALGRYQEDGLPREFFVYHFVRGKVVDALEVQWADLKKGDVLFFIERVAPMKWFCSTTYKVLDSNKTGDFLYVKWWRP